MKRVVVVVAIVAIVGCGAGCGVDVDVPDFHPVEAGIDHVSIGSAAVVGGGAIGGGVLNVTDDEDRHWQVPVSISSWLAGGVFAFAIDASPAAVDLAGADDDLRGADLFGGYQGTAAAIDVVIGVGEVDVVNDSGVAVVIGGEVGAGVSAFYGAAWLDIKANGELQELP